MTLTYVLDAYRGDPHPHAIYNDHAPSGLKHPACVVNEDYARLFCSAPLMLSVLKIILDVMDNDEVAMPDEAARAMIRQVVADASPRV